MSPLFPHEFRCHLCLCRPPLLVSVRLPDAGVQRPRDAQPHAHRDAHHQGDNQDPDYYPIALTQACQRLAGPVVDASGLGFLFPVLLAGPDLAVGTAFQVAVACALHTAGVVGGHNGSCRDHGLEVCVEGVEVMMCRSGGRDIGEALEFLRCGARGVGGGCQGRRKSLA